MFEALTDGQYWSLAIMGALIIALVIGLLGAGAELYREGAK